jgi:hypothetical protein
MGILSNGIIARASSSENLELAFYQMKSYSWKVFKILNEKVPKLL